MKRILSLALVCALTLSLSGCSAGYEELTAQPVTLSAAQLAAQEDQAPAVYDALSGFGLSLLRGAREEGNTLVSPLSAALALAMTANGAAGDTLAQFESLLGGGASLDALNAVCSALTDRYEAPGGSTRCAIANSLWTDPEGRIRKDFIGRCQGIFDAQVLSAQLSDPGIVPALNGWVSDHTEGMIPSVVSQPFDQETAILLVNALYLENTWRTQFEPRLTGERDFTHRDGRAERIDFLQHHSQRFPYLEDEASQGVLLPYDDGQLAFFALMPRLYPDAPDFDAWLEDLDGAQLAALIQSAQGQEEALFLRLSLPKFQAEWDGELADVLAGPGLDLAFTQGAADFSLLGDSPYGYYLSQVIHAAKIEVNEKGTKAAAATVVAGNEAAAPSPEGLELDFDRPFLYGIVDLDTGVPLFLGTFE